MRLLFHGGRPSKDVSVAREQHMRDTADIDELKQLAVYVVEHLRAGTQLPLGCSLWHSRHKVISTLPEHVEPPKLQFIWLVWYACHAQAQVGKLWSSWTWVWDAYSLIAICTQIWNVNTSSVTAASAKLCESAFQESVCMWNKENMYKRNWGAETNGCILGPGSLRAVWVQVRGWVGREDNHAQAEYEATVSSVSMLYSASR